MSDVVERLKDAGFSPRSVPLVYALIDQDTFLDRIQNDDFAAAVYASFCNRRWRSRCHEQMISWRSAGEVIATLRDKGETYLDWYGRPLTLSTPEGAEVLGLYNAMGWESMELS